MINYVEYAICTVILICELILFNEWAKYGVMEFLVKKPFSPLVFNAGLVTGTTILLTIVLQKKELVDFKFIYLQNYWPLIGLFIGVPTIWLFVKRYIFMPPGQFDYHRASLRTSFLAIKHYRPGVLLEAEGELLKNYSWAIKALKLFKNSIATLKKGTLEINPSITVDLDTAIIYKNSTVATFCPACSIPITAAIYAPDGATSHCIYCGKIISAKTIKRKLHLYSLGPGISSQVLPINQNKLAASYREMAFLHRMMNSFDECHYALDEAERLMMNLLKGDPGNYDYLELKALIVFQCAEAYQTEAIQHQKARDLYLEYLELCHKTEKTPDFDLIKQLLSKLQ